jgi:hypothetical protein
MTRTSVIIAGKQYFFDDALTVNNKAQVTYTSAGSITFTVSGGAPGTVDFIEDSDSGLVAAGFCPCDVIAITGSVNNDNKLFNVISVAADIMEVMSIGEMDAEVGAVGTIEIHTVLNTAVGGSGVVDHGGLAGLDDDDHIVYLLADGTRNIAGDILVNTDKKIKFRDAAIYIQSANDGHLDLTADTVIDMNGTTQWGDGTNYLQVSSTGVLTLAGTSKRHLSMRPSFVAGKISGGGAPTAVSIGAYSGYSMPIWSTPANQYEELYWRLLVPGRWDGASDIAYNLVVALSAAEDVGDDFNFQLSWANIEPTTGAMSSSTTDVTVDTNITAGHSAQYSIFKLAFTIDWDIVTPDIAISDLLVGRIRRVATAGTEVSNEVIVLDHQLVFQVDKLFKA